MFSDSNLQLKNKRNLQDGFIEKLGKLQLVHQLHQTEAENKKLTDELTQSKWVNQELAQQLAKMEKENRNLMQLNKQFIEKKQCSSSHSPASRKEDPCRMTFAEKVAAYLCTLLLFGSTLVFIVTFIWLCYNDIKKNYMRTKLTKKLFFLKSGMLTYFINKDELDKYTFV